MDDKWWRKVGTWLCILGFLWWILLLISFSMEPDYESISASRRMGPVSYRGR